jgi:hypothetical protein
MKSRWRVNEVVLETEELLSIVSKRLYGGGRRQVVGGDFVVRDGGRASNRTALACWSLELNFSEQVTRWDAGIPSFRFTDISQSL